MNNAQQYIKDYLTCGYKHYRWSITPIPTRMHRELYNHCDSSVHWEKVGRRWDRQEFFNKTNDIIVTVITHGWNDGGISHNY